MDMDEPICGSDEGVGKRQKVDDTRDCSNQRMLDMQEQMMRMFTDNMQKTMAAMMEHQVAMAEQQMRSLLKMQASTASSSDETQAPAVAAPAKKVSEIPDSVHKVLGTIQNKFERKVRAFVKIKDRVRKAKEDHEVMAGDSNHNRYPPGTPACSIGVTDVEADSQWSKSKEEEKRLELVIPKGATRRRVIELLHHFSVTNRKMIELEVADAKRDLLQVEAAKNTFMKTCEEAVAMLYASDPGTDLGCDPVVVVPPDARALKELCIKMYDETVTKVNKDHAEKKAEIEKKKEDNKKKEQEAMQEQPEALLEGVISSVVRTEMAAAERDDLMVNDDEKADNTKSDDKKEVERLKKLVEVLKSKNGKSPGGDRGEIQTPWWRKRGDGKPGTMGAGKGQSQTKGKGKSSDKDARSWWNASCPKSGKAKGKGKQGKKGDGKGSGSGGKRKGFKKEKARWND